MIKSLRKPLPDGGEMGIVYVLGCRYIAISVLSG
jgi:hypothetical protein